MHYNNRSVHTFAAHILLKSGKSNVIVFFFNYSFWYSVNSVNIWVENCYILVSFNQICFIFSKIVWYNYFIYWKTRLIYFGGVSLLFLLAFTEARWPRTIHNIILFYFRFVEKLWNFNKTNGSGENSAFTSFDERRHKWKQSQK